MRSWRGEFFSVFVGVGEVRSAFFGLWSKHSAPHRGFLDARIHERACGTQKSMIQRSNGKL